MNIMQLTSNLDSPERGRDIIDSTRFLTLNGHKIVVVSLPAVAIKEIDEVGARHYALPLRPNIFMIPFIVPKLVGIISQENIQIIHSRCAFSALVSFLAARFSGKPFVHTIYSIKESGIFRRAEYWAKKVMCFDEISARQLVKDGFISEKRIKIIPPFISEKTLENRRAAPEKTSSHVKMIIKAVLPASVPDVDQKFIRAISILSRSVNGMKVFIINETGVWENDAKEKIDILIKRHLLTGVIEFVRRDNYTADFKEDFFVQINQRDSFFPRFFLDAASRGVPVFMNRSELPGDCAGCYEGAVVFDLDNPRELSDKMVSLRKDVKRSLNLVDGAMNFVKKEFGIKKIMNSTLKLYEEASEALSILIIKIGALGDVILAAPSMRAIREKFPMATIKLLTGIENREVFTGSPYIDEIIVSDFKNRDNGFGGVLRIGRRLRAENFDITIDFQNSKKSHILSFLSCAAKRYGYDNGKFSFLINRKIKDDRTPLAPVKHQLRVLGLLGIYNIDEKLELRPTKEASEWTDSFLAAHWVKPGSRIVAINIGSSPRWITKLWPTKYFVELCDKLAKRLNARIVLIGLEKESDRIDMFLKSTKSKPIIALGKTTIPKLIALVKKCDLLISGDSAPIHVAASTGTSFVGLFGPTDPKRHLPPSENCIVLQKDMKCSPCYRTSCGRGYECMNSISPDEVYRAVLKLFKVEAR